MAKIKILDEVSVVLVIERKGKKNLRVKLTFRIDDVDAVKSVDIEQLRLLEEIAHSN